MALNSTTNIQILDLLCEAPMGGIIGGRRGIFLNETALQNEDGTYNFDYGKDVLVSVRRGGRTNDNTGIFQGKDGVSVVTAVGQEIGQNYSEELDSNNLVKKRDYGAGSLVRRITNLDVTKVQLTFTIPKLFSVAQEGLAKGQLFYGKVELRIYVQALGSGDGFKKVKTYTKQGISTNNYQFQTSYIDLTNTGEGPWNIKVRKVNLKEDFFEVQFKDFEDIPKKTPLASSRGNQVIWSSITEVVPQSVNYSYSATVEMQLSSKIFPELPNRAYLIKGRSVKIPSNATVVNDDKNTPDGYLRFTGDFDGSLKDEEKWTTCPVCCFYDLLTNTRYGAGHFIDESNLSWTDLYDLCRYSNELIDIPDGSGDQEPRFACNVVISDRADAFSVLRDMASVFRGILFWSNNTIQVAGDHGGLEFTDLPVSHIYSNSNVIDGVFEYSGSSLKTRSTSIRVRYNDPENFYKPNFVVLEDADLIAKYGYQVKEIIGFGCTSKWQAMRIAKWVLLTEALDTETISFATGLQGAVVYPGEIFAVADELRQGARISGRIASATTTVIVADQNITLPSGSNPKLTVLMRDGSVATADIDNVSGSTITLKTALSDDPKNQSIWSITTSAVANQKFRCISVADNGDGTFTITGVAHNDSIYAAVDQEGESLEFLDITTFDEKPPKVSDIDFSAGQTTSNTDAKLQVDISWNRGTSGATFGYEVKYSTTNKNVKTAQTTDPNFTVSNLKAGEKLTVQIKALGLGGKKKSGETKATFTVPSFSTSTTGKGSQTKKPEDPKNVSVEVLK